MDFDKVFAVCRDCPKKDAKGKEMKLIGPITIEAFHIPGMNALRVLASGYLYSSLASHHDHLRDPEDKTKSKPQHNLFDIYLDGECSNKLGYMGATTQGREVAFHVENGKLLSDLTDEANAAGSIEGRY